VNGRVEDNSVRKTLKWIGLIIGSLIGLIVIAVVVILSIGRARFNEKIEVDVPSLAIPTDEAALARGEHLVKAVAHCGYCHGDDLSGDIVVNQPGSQGVIVAPNLTAGEGGIGASYTSEDWVRTIRHGVTPAGRSVIIMPSLLFNVMSAEDLTAVIAYLQTIPPIDNNLPATQLGPMFYALIGAGPLTKGMSGRVIDHDAPYTPAQEEGETAEYGAYLAQIGQCIACHGPELAGGRGSQSAPFAPNLTPGGELQGWTKTDFITVLRTGTHPTGRQLDTFMPWKYFQNMTETELGAIWAYLQAQPARESVSP